METAKPKMSIAQIGPVPPPTGGVAANMLAIHEELLRHGHAATMIDVTDRTGTMERKDVIKPRSVAGLLRALVAGKYDIVHYHIGGRFDGRLAMLTLVCGLLPGKKSVVTFHSGGYAQEAVGTARPFSLRGIAFRSVDLLIGVNEQILQMFKAYGLNGTKTRHIFPFELKRPDPNIQIPEEVESAMTGFDPMLLSVGALEPEYNNDFLISAMPTVLDRHPNAGLVVVGSGSLEKSLRVPNAIRERVILTGDLDHQVVLSLIERASALLRVTDYDGDAISVREALFLDTPVIASDNDMRPNGVFLLKRPFAARDLVIGIEWAEKAQFPGQLAEVGEVGNAAKVVEAYRELLGK